MLKDKQAVIFDLDGTLVDSMWMWKEIDIEYLGRYGHTLPEELQDQIEGMSFTETAIFIRERFRIPDSTDKMKADWLEMAREKYRTQVPLKKGALPFLQLLKKRGIRLGIATSNGVELVREVLEALDITSYFDSVHTCCEVARGKPAPDIYLLVAEELGVCPEACLVFEDVVAGIMAGNNAGMTTCAVEDACSLAQTKEKKELADYYIKDYYEVIKQKQEETEV